MNFTKELSFSSFNDAWLTYKNHFNHNASLEKFLTATSNAECTSYKIKDIIALEPLNLNLDRLNAETPEEAYPIDDRPRGINDIKSIKYHQTHPCNPIVMIYSGNKLIFADGVHRLVAAKLLGKRNVICCIIYYDITY